MSKLLDEAGKGNLKKVMEMTALHWISFWGYPDLYYRDWNFPLK